MPRFLKQNTAIRLTVGPFLDPADGVTPETSLTVTSCHLTLMVDTGDVPTLALDADATASGGNNDMVHVTGDDAGFYDLELTAAQTNYVGRAILAITDATNHLPVWHEFMILPANVYDSLLGADNLEVDIAQWRGSQPNTLQSGRVDSYIGAVASGVIAAASFASGALDAVWSTTTRLLTAGTNIALAKGTGVTGFNDLDAAGVRSAVGLASANIDTQLGDLPTNSELATALAGADDAVLAAIADVQADTDDIQTRLPAALVSGRMDASVGEYQTGLTPLQPTTAGRTLDVNVNGEAGVDLDNTSGTLVKGTDITGFNDLSAAQVNAEADQALADYDAPTKAELDSGLAALNDLDAAGVRTALGLASANLDSQLGDLPTNSELATALAAADDAVLAAIAALNDLSGTEIGDAVLDEVVVGSYTMRQLLRGFAAALLSKASGMEDYAPVFRDITDAKDVITATTDSDGNRTAVTLDLT